MSEAETIGGGLPFNRSALTKANDGHDYRGTKRRDPGDESGAEAARTRASSYTPRDGGNYTPRDPAPEPKR